MAEQITTAAELDALPVGSIVRHSGGTAVMRAGFDDWGDVPEYPWQEVPADLSETAYSTTGVMKNLHAPLTVVFRPDRDLLAEARAEGYEQAVMNARPEYPDAVRTMQMRSPYRAEQAGGA